MRLVVALEFIDNRNHSVQYSLHELSISFLSRGQFAVRVGAIAQCARLFKPSEVLVGNLADHVAPIPSLQSMCHQETQPDHPAEAEGRCASTQPGLQSARGYVPASQHLGGLAGALAAAIPGLNLQGMRVAKRFVLDDLLRQCCLCCMQVLESEPPVLNLQRTGPLSSQGVQDCPCLNNPPPVLQFNQHDDPHTIQPHESLHHDHSHKRLHPDD
mmetsp:Transcript_14743/g.24583  ORF Transcript_14743/g.24583 Transcript_14743/m.24583 type:complete len:214 (+) Transcript_14743:466-1107(+)